jgi:hypothetical protein
MYLKVEIVIPTAEKNRISVVGIWTGNGRTAEGSQFESR